MKRTVLGIVLLAAALQGQAIRTNAGFSANSIPANDDGSGPLTPLGFTLNFFGRTRSAAWVNNNGNITFDAPLATYTPFGLENTRREIIAAFFADVDTRPTGSRLVTYGTDTVDGRPAFGANYINVGYYQQHADKLNSFQIVVIERSDTGPGNFDIEFNYERILWETGDASGGVNGLGGVPVSVGWSNGSGLPGTSFELEGSFESGAFLDRSRRALSRTRLNSTVRGRYVFRGRDGSILPPLTILSACPLPGASLGSSYAQRLSAVGGTNYRWSMVADPGATLPAGITLSQNGTFSGVPSAAGTTEFTLRLDATTESGEEVLTRRCSLTVEAPVLSVSTACPLPQATVGQSYNRTLAATGARGPYTWSLAEGSAALPVGLALSSAGVVSGVPTEPGTSIVTLRVSSSQNDGSTPAVRQCSITVAPSVLAMGASCALPAATVGVPYTRELAMSGGAPPYTWTATGGVPPGLSLSPAGVLSGTPSGPFNGTMAASVRDSRGNNAVQTCSIEVSAPVIGIEVAPVLPAGRTGQAYSQRLGATGGSAPYTWSALTAVPAGLTLSADGVLSGTPGSAGNFGLRFLVSDAEGRSAAKGANLTILRSEFSVGSCPMPNATVGVDYTQRMTVAGGLEPYLFSTTGGVPAGMTLHSSGLLTGRPREAGTFLIGVTVMDAQGRTTTQPCPVTVRPSDMEVMASCPLPAGRVGAPYLQRFTVSGGMPPYRFRLDGALPVGLELSADGAVRGIPLAVVKTNWEVEVTDASSRSVAKACALDVELPALPPMRMSAVPATVQPATAGPAVSFELGQAYALPVQGRLVLTVEAETGATEAAINQADPAVRFTNGQRVQAFTLAPGSTRATATVASTGTVASLVTVRVEDLKAGGIAINTPPSPRQFRVAKAAPLLTDACYTPTAQGLDVTLTGFSTTRQLGSAALKYTYEYFGSPAEQKEKEIDISGFAGEYFGSDFSVRSGGAFTVSVPFELSEPSPTGVSVSITNGQGTSAVRNLQRCR